MLKMLIYSLLLIAFTSNVYSEEIYIRRELPAYQNSLHEDKIGSRYYVKITFKNIPLLAEFERIESKGIKFLDYVPRNTYYCSIDSKSINDEFGEYGIISIDTIPLENKISYELIEGIPDWMEVNEGKVKLNIEYFKGIKDYETLKQSLASLDAEILEHYEYFNRFYIRINFDKLRQLASLPWVMYVDTDNKPLTTENYQAGQSHTANALRLENSLGGRGLTGEGVKIGIFDDGMIGQHIDFDNRVTQLYQGNYGEHATHCLGTIGGTGKIDINASGMAPKSDLYSWYAGDYSGMLQGIQNYGIMLTSNSYGYMSQSSCGLRGKYDGNSKYIDKITRDTTYFLHIFAAGNDATSCNNGWNTIGDGPNSSKNIITVGAIDKSNAITSFSGRGPLVDGRLKPEITSVGANVYSPIENNSYKYSQGTSMATPGVTGTVALLYERFMQLNNGGKPDASLIKGIVCNTADDLGNIGPDYIYGYGKINGLRAVRLIEQGNYYSNNISQSNVQTQNISIPANIGQLKVALCWTDREALAYANPAIVNNLDVKVTLNGIDYYPWILNPSNPAAIATRGNDSLNVVEFVSIDNPNQGNCVISVSGSSIPFGPQKYFVAYEFVNKGIELTYPLAKDRITPNVQQILRWNSFGLIDSVSIELSTNNGLNWTLLSKVPNNKLYYNWIPTSSQCTGQAKIKLSSGNYTFAMDSTFSIFPQPANFALSTGDDESINMQWNPVANAIGYEIMKLNNNFEWEVLDTITQTSFNVSGLIDFNSYWLTLVALGNNGAKSQRLPAKSCQVITAYHTPKLHFPSDGEWSVELATTFRWIKLRDTVNYQIQISINNQFSQLIANNITNDSLYVSDSLDYSTEYFWRVRAMRQNDTTDWSEIRQFKTKEDPALAINENSSGNTLWAWGANYYAELGFYEYSKPTLQSNKKWRTIETGELNTIGIDSDGYLWAWGYGGRNGDGTSVTRYEPVQIGTNKWLTISFNYATGHAIREDSTLWGWGLNSSGQVGDGTQINRTGIVQIGIGSKWIAVSNGNDHTIAIKNDGSLWTWGANHSGQLGDSTTVAKLSPIRIGIQNDWEAVSAGWWYNLSLKSNGTLWSWGNNSYAQLGDSTTSHRLFPKQIGKDNNWRQISTGKFTNHAIKIDQSLWAWGYNDYGQIGDGSTSLRKLFPLRIGTDNDWEFVSTGENHTVAIKTDGTVWNWGSNSWNKLLSTDNQITYCPIVIKNFSNARVGTCYSEQTIILLEDSLLYSWGKNDYGQLGILNSQKIYDYPIKLKNISGIRKIFSSNQHSLIITNYNKCYVFGSNQPASYVGINPKIQPIKPVSLIDSIEIKNVYLGNYHNLIQTKSGEWYAWGVNQYGCFGNGSSSNTVNSTPIQTPLDNAFKSISLGEYYSIGIKGNGTLWAWGRNNYGQLGDSSTNNLLIPKQITIDNDWEIVACGLDFTIAIKSDGSLWSWGNNNVGQLGDSSTTNRYFPVRIGNQNDWKDVDCGSGFTIAKKTDGTLWAWGRNNDGQLGDSSYSNRFYPVRVGNSSDWKDFACGNSHCLAIKANGTLCSWGFNNAGSLGDSTKITRNYPKQIGNKTDWIKIAASRYNTFAICSPSGFVAPTLVMPTYNKRISNSDTIFVWNSVEDATKYQFQLGYDTIFVNKIVDIATNDTTRNFPEFAITGVYYWRVRAMNDYDTTSWSQIWKYRISDFDQQEIMLNQGWNMISGNVEPVNKALSEIMSPLTGKLQTAKNISGQVYSPPFQTSLSTWNIYQAYQIRMNQAATLPLTGLKIIPENTPISIASGTYWLPYLRSSALATSTALNSIQGKYLQVKTISGQVYQPPFFLSLSQLQPNLGYILLMTQSGILTYPANAVTKSASTGEVVIREPQVFVRDMQITGKTAVIAMDLQNIEDGDEIGVFTRDGMLVGSSVWQYGMHGVVVWGDDETTNDKDGAAEGEALTVKVWNKATKNIGSINQIALNDMTNNAESFELTYETDAVHLLKGAAELSSNETKLFVSPQPASTELMVKLNVTTENEIDVKIYSQEGKLSLETSTNANGNVLKVNTSNLSSGVYQMIMTIDGKTYSEKVVVVR